MQDNYVRSSQEANSICYLRDQANKLGLKGSFYTNIKPKDTILFDQKFFDDIDISPNNKTLVDFLKTRYDTFYWDFISDLKKINKAKLQFECDIIYVENNVLKAVIEIHGKHHKHACCYGQSPIAFTKVCISDYFKELYCAEKNILFADTYLEDNKVNFNDLDKIIQNLKSN
jgi:hypothetical protein